jgi:phage shock protein A
LARALEDADGDLIKQIRTLREQLKEASETEAALKAQITDLRQKAAQNPALTAANQQFSALAKVSDQEQRRTKLMELCQGLVGSALDSILDLITPNHKQLSGDQAMRLLLACYLCSGKNEHRGGQHESSDAPS